MTAEGTLAVHLDFLHREIDETTGEIKQYGFIKGGVTKKAHIVLNRAARSTDGLIGVETVTDMCQVNFILLMDPPPVNLTGEELDAYVKAQNKLFTRRFVDKFNEYEPLTDERVTSGMAVHATSSYQDKIQARSR